MDGWVEDGWMGGEWVDGWLDEYRRVLRNYR